MNCLWSRRRSHHASFVPTWSASRCSATTLNRELSSDILNTVEKRCGRRPKNVRETTAAPGQTNRHFQVQFSDGSAVLVKASRAQTAPEIAKARFIGEQKSLDCLRRYGGALIVPKAHGVGGTRAQLSLIEWVELAPFGLWKAGKQAELGGLLAKLHKRSMNGAGERAKRGFGFETDTFLGELRLHNGWCEDWVRFFIEQRLAPRLQDALLRSRTQYGTSNEDVNALRAVARRVQDVERVREVFFGKVSVQAALLHGDLFSGNCGVSKVGRSCVIFDPASFWGHYELDLAVSTLFGRFQQEFYNAYHAVLGREQGFAARRVLYRFYYLLTLLVQHGGGYGRGGSTVDPKGYFEMCCEHADDLREMLG